MMPSPRVDLSGRWIGQYVQRDREYPIEAEFTQDGDRLVGRMRDGTPTREQSLFDLAAEAGLPPGADERLDAHVRAMIPDTPRGPVRYVSQLPPESIVEGRVDGVTVAFTKTYAGESFGGYRVGDRFVGVKRPGHAVHYEGGLSADGGTIAGRWWIDADPESGTLRTEGEFLLRRREPAGEGAG